MSAHSTARLAWLRFRYWCLRQEEVFGMLRGDAEW